MPQETMKKSEKDQRAEQELRRMQEIMTKQAKRRTIELVDKENFHPPVGFDEIRKAWALKTN